MATTHQRQQEHGFFLRQNNRMPQYACMGKSLNNSFSDRNSQLYVTGIKTKSTIDELIPSLPPQVFMSINGNPLSLSSTKTPRALTLIPQSIPSFQQPLLI